jgi:hypothetical protein
MWRIWGKGEIQTRLWWGNLREDLELALEWNGVRGNGTNKSSSSTNFGNFLNICGTISFSRSVLFSGACYTEIYKFRCPMPFHVPDIVLMSQNPSIVSAFSIFPPVPYSDMHSSTIDAL